jgi:GDP-mannose 6-dehydrogenase
VGERLEQISGKRIGEEFGVAMNPEFLRAFRSVEDFQRPRVTVIGGYDERSGDLVEAIYSGIWRQLQGLAWRKLR